MCGIGDQHFNDTRREPEVKFKQPDQSNDETAPRALDDLSELLEVNKQILATLKEMVRRPDW